MLQSQKNTVFTVVYEHFFNKNANYSKRNRNFVLKLNKKNTMGTEIIINKGYGDLEFGMTVPQTESILGSKGAPEASETPLGEPLSIVAHEEAGLTLFFEDEPFALKSIEIYDLDSTLFNEPVFDLGKKEITEIMKKNGFPESETAQEDWGETSLSFPEANIDFFFEGDELISILMAH